MLDPLFIPGKQVRSAQFRTHSEKCSTIVNLPVHGGIDSDSHMSGRTDTVF